MPFPYPYPIQRARREGSRSEPVRARLALHRQGRAAGECVGNVGRTMVWVET